VWTPAELGEFLSVIEDSNHYPLLLTAAMTGMRRGELCGLGWAQVDLEAGTIEVTRNLTVTDGVQSPVEPTRISPNRHPVTVCRGRSRMRVQALAGGLLFACCRL